VKETGRSPVLNDLIVSGGSRLKGQPVSHGFTVIWRVQRSALAQETTAEQGK
jgi:hypothetical protein